MSVIRKNDYKEYVALKKTVDDIYPSLPPTTGSNGVGIWTQYRTIYTTSDDWITHFNTLDLDTEFCLKYGDRWLNQVGAVGLHFDSTTKEFEQSRFSDLNDLAKMLSNHYGTKWQKLYDLMNIDYKPLDNWDGKEDVDGDWTKNGTKDTDNTTTFNGGDTRTDTYNLSTTDNNTRTLGTTETTTYNIATTDNNSRTLSNTDTTTFGSTVTDTQVASGGTVDEVLTSGFNSGNSGTHPATVTTGTDGSQSVSGTDYVPKSLEKITKSDGKKTSGKTGTDEVAHTGTISDSGTGGKTGTEALGSSGTIGDVGTGSTTGTMTRGTVFNDRNNVFDGTQTYDLDGTDDRVTTYTGFMDRTGRGTRQALGEQEWEFRKHLFLEEVFKDTAEFITLKIY